MTNVQELTYVDPETGEYQSRGPALRDIQEWLTIARLDFSRLSTEYDVLVDVGRKLGKIHDDDRWVLGDIVYQRVQAVYGEGTVEQYADDIGWARSTVYQYRDVSRMFELSIRLELFEELPSLTWSHYYQAARIDTADSTDLLKRINQTKQADLYAAVREQELSAAISFLFSAQFQDQGAIWAARSKMRKEINKFLHKKAAPETHGVYEGSAEEIINQMTQAMTEGGMPIGRLKAVVSYEPTPPADELDPLPEGMKPVFTWAEPEDIERVKRLSSTAGSDGERLP